MTPLSKLWDLREEVKFWDYKVETSYPQNASEMIDKLMSYSHIKAMLGSVIVKYNPAMQRFYGVNVDFDFNRAVPDEEWIISD